MPDLIWINGQTMPLADARISVEDRGFQFADGVYETLRLYNARPFALPLHLDRLERSCAGIGLALPLSKDALAVEMVRLCEQAAVPDGMLYLQLTRGVAPRNHLYPAAPKPTLLFYVRPIPPLAPIGSGAGVSLLSVPDERWNRCWVKSISLLAHVLAKNAAAAAGADEAAFIENGVVSECSSSNLFAVLDGTLVTAPVGPRVLPGITRAILLEIAPRVGISVEERSMTQQQAMDADEIFIASTLRELAWVSRWDGRSVGTTCSPVTNRLHTAFRDRIASSFCD